ncbi:restriction endonuclease subunit S [Capnocytophaga granulosa]|uniref:restriction endonuclease subunit S n=1 Tax=Capnocytophaga granulosa TaxID=45242 RepID=UPI0023F53673|nr:restriction endonuclease subunit S [Capnocytophaga granulosa]
MTQEPKIFPYIARLLQGAEVVWKPLGEVAEYIRGITYNKQAEIQHKDGWKVLRANNITLKSRQLDFNDIKVIDKSIKVRDNQHLYKGDILICAGSGSREHIGKTAYIFENLEYIFGGFMGVIRTNEEYLLSRFLFHYLGSSSFSTYLNKELNSSTINNLNSSIMNKFQIPLPPLSVQQEIVRILDKFTQLEAELEAELDCRKQQYEYYRNKLLSYEGNEVEWKTLDQISENLDSKRRPITSGLRTSGKIPYYGASGIVDYVEDYIFDGDFLLISEDGANLLARNTPIAFSVSGKIWVNNHAHILKFRTYEERRFIEFYLNKTDLTPYISGAAQPKLNKKNLNSIKFPIPPLEEQQRIASILDKFDTLVNSISEGLPKEIALRRKQYEYYRERLLSF